MRHESKKHIYKNGLILLVDEAPQLKSVAIAAWIKTGSRHEDISQAGICHFLEHMLFKGSKKNRATEISKEVDRVGGDFNAFTSREHTCFHFYLPAKELPLGAKLLKEVLFRPLFDPREIERERKVILQEISVIKESPEEDAFDTFIEKIFGIHPLGRQILGLPKTIDALSRPAIREFFYRHYRPENMIISVSGAVSFEKAKRELSALGSAPWPNRSKNLDPLHLWGFDPPENTESGFWWKKSDTEQSHLLFGIPAPVHNSRERMAANILQQYLGGGMSSVLFDLIREKKGWAYNIYAAGLQFLDVNLFTVYAGVKSDHVKDCIQVFLREMKRVEKKGIAQKDLVRLQESILCSFVLSLESSESRVMNISNSELFYKRPFEFKEFEKQVWAVTSKDIQNLMHRWLHNVKPTILVLSSKPKDKKEWQAIEDFAQRITGKPLQLEK